MTETVNKNDQNFPRRSVVQIYPPLPHNYPPNNEQVVKTLLSIRNLSESSQKTYAKCLKRLQRDSELNNPSKVEDYIFSKEWKNKTKNIYLNAYTHYCRAARADYENLWDQEMK